MNEHLARDRSEAPARTTPGAERSPVTSAAPGLRSRGRDPNEPATRGDPGAAPRIDGETIRFFWRFLRDDRWKLWISSGLLFLSAALPVVMGLVPWIMSRYWARGDLPTLWLILAILFGVSLLGMVIQYGLTFLAADVSQGFTRRLRSAIYGKLGRMSGQQMSDQSVGVLAHRSTGDAMRIQSLLTPGVPEAISNLAQLLFIVVALLVLSRWWAVSALVMVLIIGIAVRRVTRVVRGLSRQAQKLSESIMTSFIDGVGGYRDLVASGRYDRTATTFTGQLESLKRVAVRTSLWSSAASLLPFLAVTLLIFAYYFVQTSDVSRVGDLEYLGKILSFTMLLSLGRNPAIRLTGFVNETALAAPSLYEVRRLLESPEVVDSGRSPLSDRRDIEFDRVSFSFSPGDAPILNGISFRVEHGSFTAIVGQTGSGKTTLFHLLLRLLDPQQGEVRLGGTPLSALPLTDLRRTVGFIPQNPFIFDSTIRDNLCIGLREDEIDEHRVREAIRLSRLEELLARRGRSGGLSSRVGSGGASLSGGEKQRLALGRIFLRKPDVIICDEYTANIDTATARLIQESLATEFAGKTRIVISHQLYSVRDADEILVLDGGRIVSRGVHQDLIARPGLYRQIWELQRLS